MLQQGHTSTQSKHQTLVLVPWLVHGPQATDQSSGSVGTMGVSLGTRSPFPLLIVGAVQRRATVPSHLAPDPDSGTKPNTDVPEKASIDVVQVEEEEATLPSVQASSSSSLDKIVTGTSNLLLPNGFRAHQELLKRVMVNLGLEVEELKESAHSLVDILAAAASFQSDAAH